MQLRISRGFVLVSCGALAAAAAAAQASVPAFGRCLREHDLPTTLREATSGNAPTQRLVLPDRLPSAAVIDGAFAACRRHVHWPKGFGDAKLVLRLRADGRRFRACMRALGRDPGPVEVVLVDTGVGLAFPRLRWRPPARCARLLPSR